MAYDQYFGSVVTLLKCNGVEGGSLLADSSSFSHTYTMYGNAKTTTAESKYGGSSLYLDGVGDYAATPGSSALTLGTEDFTIEMWVLKVPGATQIYPRLIEFGPNSVNGGLWLNATAVTADSFSPFADTYTSGYSSAVPSSGTYTQGVWSHLALTRSGSTWTLWLNGNSIGTGTKAGYNVVINYLFIGANNTGGESFKGYLSDIRITKGVSRYSTAFTPPTEAFPTRDSEYANASLSTTSGAQLDSYGGGYANVAAPAPAFFGGILLTATASLISPSPTLFARGGASANLTAPGPALISAGHNSYGEKAAFLVAPSPTLSVTTGAHARTVAPRPALSASGTVTTWAKAALTAPSPTLSASGTVSGMASANLASPSPNLVGYGGAVCSITITGKATLTATGTTGSIGGAALSCPLFELTASATAQNHGSANLLAPSPRMGVSAQAWLIAPSAQLTAIGSAVVTATYEAYAINLGHRNPEATTDEVTRYTNFPFTHVVRYQNSYYGANSTGLYLLEGTTDEATPIPWSFKTGITDFDDAKQKTVAAAYFGGSMPPATTVTLFEGDKVGVPYAQTTPRGADLQNYRETFARGVKGRYYALGLSGTGKIELDDLDFEIKQLTRRI